MKYRKVHFSKHLRFLGIQLLYARNVDVDLIFKVININTQWCLSDTSTVDWSKRNEIQKLKTKSLANHYLIDRKKRKKSRL